MTKAVRWLAIAGAALVFGAICGSLGYETGRWWTIQTLNDSGMAALKESRLRDAEHYYVVLDDLGDRGAAHWLGMIYVEDDGVPIDHDKALFWFKKADDPKPYLYLQLGRGYEYGESGTPKNKREALFWYHQAVLLGSAEAKLRYDALSASR